jgi:hypothetical protein
MRVPNSGPAERARRELIEHYSKALRRLQRIPPHRREGEHADIGEETCRAMLGVEVKEVS